MDNRLLVFARLALAVAERVVPDRASRFAPRRYRQPQLLACILVKEHLCLDYRTAEELIAASDGLRSALGLPRVPDHSTLWWFARRRRLDPDRLAEALAETVRRAQRQPGSGPGPSRIALASTGLWLSHTSWYFAWQARRERGQRGWLKWAMALWTGPQILVAQRVRPGPCGDFSDLVPLATTAHAVLPFDQLVADAGYDSEANHRFCREGLGVDSLIPAKKRRSAAVLATTPFRQEMLLRRLTKGGADPEARRAYRQRWKAETAMSVTKRRWGDALSARLEATQRVQALLRGVVYNLCRLVTLAAQA
jgi:hypothetical protein